jgi:hypothetical protein
MIAQVPNLTEILEHHGIHPKFWPEFRAHVEEGVKPGKELQVQLDHVANYKAALREAIDERGFANYKALLKEAVQGIECEHTFAPPDYQSPVPYESLLLEEIESEALASAGAPSAAR